MLLSILEEVRVALTGPAAVSADPRFARAGRNRPRAEWLCTCCLSGYRSPEKCEDGCMSFLLCVAKLRWNLVLRKTPQETLLNTSVFGSSVE